MKDSKVCDRLGLIETIVFNRETNGHTKFDEMDERMRDLKIGLTDQLSEQQTKIDDFIAKMNMYTFELDKKIV